MSNVLDAARRELRRGRQPIPVPHRSKFPPYEGWQNLVLSEEDLPAHFNGHPQNLGVLNGVHSANHVDLDLDCPEALMLSSRHLPSTDCMFGRASKRRSHRIYVCDPLPATKKFQDINGQMLVEVRSTGTQTIFPPSTHPSGEAVTWDQDGEPARVDGLILLAEASKLAAACILARHWPQIGARQDAALALAGGLLRAGWTEDETHAFIEDVASAAGDDETAKRAAAAEYTQRRIDQNRTATGWRRLAQFVGADVVERARDWLNIQGDGGSAENDGEATGTRRGPSQATMLVDLATSRGVELFHSSDSEAYARVPVGDHWETMLLKQKAFRHWLSRHFYEEHAKVPGSQALQDAIATLHGHAIFQGEERPVCVRMAEHGGAFYLDLGDPKWQVVRITASGWQVIAGHDAPVTFRRPSGLRSLPLPIRGGSVDELQRFVNLADEDDWRLVVAWLLAALRPTGPYPVLALSGEQGSAKSTTARVLRRLVDPNQVELRAEPRNQHDLAIAATNGWIIGLDNLSAIPAWLSDALCRLATGGGFATRELYTDAEEALFDAQRPIILTGIEEVATKGDLLDRAIPISLPAIPSERRRTEKQFWREFEATQPRILGALLDAVTVSLANVETTVLPRYPRMADFAQWVEAAAPALGWQPEAFLTAYTDNRETANDIALDSTPIAGALRSFMTERADWEGTATELLAALAQEVSETATRDRSWPKRANALSGLLKRLAPNLRQAGLDVATGIREPGGQRRLIKIRTMLPDDRHNRHSRHTAAPGSEDQTSGSSQPHVESSQSPQGSSRSDGFAAHDHPILPLLLDARDDCDDGFALDSDDGCAWEEGEV